MIIMITKRKKLAPPLQWWRFELKAVALQLHRPAAWKGSSGAENRNQEEGGWNQESKGFICEEENDYDDNQVNTFMSSGYMILQSGGNSMFVKVSVLSLLPPPDANCQSYDANDDVSRA